MSGDSLRLKSHRCRIWIGGIQVAGGDGRTRRLVSGSCLFQRGVVRSVGPFGRLGDRLGVGCCAWGARGTDTDS